MDDKKTLKAKALEFLREHRSAVISSISEAGLPQSATVTFLVDDDLNLFFVTRKSSRKYANMMKNPKVAVVVGFDPDHPSTIQMEGEAHEADGNRLVMLLQFSKDMAFREQWWPLLKIAGLDFVIMEVKPDWMRWLNLDVSPGGADYKEDFYQVLP